MEKFFAHAATMRKEKDKNTKKCDAAVEVAWSLCVGFEHCPGHLIQLVSTSFRFPVFVFEPCLLFIPVFKIIQKVSFPALLLDETDGECSVLDHHVLLRVIRGTFLCATVMMYGITNAAHVGIVPWDQPSGTVLGLSGIPGPPNSNPELVGHDGARYEEFRTEFIARYGPGQKQYPPEKELAEVRSP